MWLEGGSTGSVVVSRGWLLVCPAFPLTTPPNRHYRSTQEKLGRPAATPCSQRPTPWNHPQATSIRSFHGFRLSWFPRDVKRAAQIQAAMNEYRRGGSDPVDAVEKLSFGAPVGVTQIVGG